MSQSARNRRERILRLVFERGHVTVKDLAGDMRVSEATVRRDLRALADRRRIEMVYGGATPSRPRDYSFQSKARRNVEAKQVIGRLAAELVEDGDTILLDSGTTLFAMVPHLQRRRGLTVIVNSIRMAAELGAIPDVHIVQIGGQYRPDRMDTVGPLALTALEQIRGYRAFIGADGLDMEFGVAASDIESAHLYRQALRNAGEAVLLVDHTKFQTPGLYKVADIEAVSRLITDREPSPEWMARLNECGVEAIYPAALYRKNDATA